MQAKTEDKSKALELRKQGFSYTYISKALNVSKGSLSLWLKEVPQPEHFTKEYLALKKRDRLDGLKEEARVRTKIRLQNRKQAKTDAKYPYDDYWLYGPVLHKREGRYYAHLKLKSNTEVCKIRLYSRYLMETHLGRNLSPEEEVDHIDNDKTNDDLSNLQILSPLINRGKSAKPAAMVSLVCPSCNKPFSRKKRQTHLVKGGNSTFCSKRCLYKHLSDTRQGVTFRSAAKIQDRVELEEKVIELHKEGLSSHKIGKQLGTSHTTSWRIIKKFKAE